MPERKHTTKMLKEKLASGEVKPEEVVTIRFSLTYAQLLDMMEIREKLGKSTSDLIRDAVLDYKHKILRMEAPPAIDASALSEQLHKEQNDLKQTLISTLKEIRKVEGETPNLDTLRPRILMFLTDFGPLNTMDLAKYVNVDWKEVDKACGAIEELGLIIREGKKWKIKENQGVD